MQTPCQRCSIPMLEAHSYIWCPRCCHITHYSGDALREGEIHQLEMLLFDSYSPELREAIRYSKGASAVLQVEPLLRSGTSEETIIAALKKEGYYANDSHFSKASLRSACQRQTSQQRSR